MEQIEISLTKDEVRIILNALSTEKGYWEDKMQFAGDELHELHYAKQANVVQRLLDCIEAETKDFLDEDEEEDYETVEG